MDPQHLQAHLQFKNMSTDINHVYSTCLDRSKEESCRNKVEIDLLNEKIKQVKSIYAELNIMLTEIKQYAPELTHSF